MLFEGSFGGCFVCSCAIAEIGSFEPSDGAIGHRYLDDAILEGFPRLLQTAGQRLRALAPVQKFITFVVVGLDAGLAQGLGFRPQQRIAGGVAEPIVEGLQPVGIAHRDRGCRARPLGLVVRAPVGQSGLFARQQLPAHRLGRHLRHPSPTRLVLPPLARRAGALAQRAAEPDLLDVAVAVGNANGVDYELLAGCLGHPLVLCRRLGLYIAQGRVGLVLREAPLLKVAMLLKRGFDPAQLRSLNRRDDGRGAVRVFARWEGVGRAHGRLKGRLALEKGADPGRVLSLDSVA